MNSSARLPEQEVHTERKLGVNGAIFVVQVFTGMDVGSDKLPVEDRRGAHVPMWLHKTAPPTHT